MPKELRCGGTMHGILSEDGRYLEVKCRRCSSRAGAGVVVLHTFDLHNKGKLSKTEKYRDPAKTQSQQRRKG